VYGNLGNGITGISKGKDLTRRTQKVHRVHREEKTRSLKTAGPSAPVKRAGAKNALRSGLNCGTRRGQLLRRFHIRAGLFDAALHEFGLHFRLLTLEEVDFRFKGPVARQFDLDTMFSWTD